LARNLIDTNAVQVMADWINSLPATPLCRRPRINPPGGTFQGSVSVTLQEPTNGVTLYYTLDNSVPTTNSIFTPGRPLDQQRHRQRPTRGKKVSSIA